MNALERDRISVVTRCWPWEGLEKEIFVVGVCRRRVFFIFILYIVL